MGSLQLAGRRDLAGKGHFGLTVGGRSFAYCYIRKNACSAFKALFVGESPTPIEAGQNPLKFMNLHHRLTAEQVEGAEVRVCVLRDPLDRVASVYRNKFVQQSGNGDIFRSYAAATGQAPQEASFEDFVLRYLSGGDLESLDPHVHAQVSHLQPTDYNAATMLDGLYTLSCDLFGPDLGERYFGRRQNATSGFAQYDEPSAGVPARSLHEQFRQTRTMPSASALYDDALSTAVRQLYSDDVALVASIATD